ncbi:ABC-2 family transporter protein (macronuclear) [Tetrahymena thermophila SB210]|uniref:ABC-2 family transporter protein n=1 Tax=Tetrahymena thermophila (strain SB210) TaxID=312017 RepID=Q22MN9_TETTS|nr:ABC-2 family transporter protein [Tetrahymena thermophila SB210]EAR86542.1 ABC-2 family transporter protein [Tetrahymena thermophila SB210]|eukprot:XP_976981.1 ABC-2 family transporter protein [Tetrahymena thermophila SB210]
MSQINKKLSPIIAPQNQLPIATKVNITFKDIKYTVKTSKGPKQLLKGVSGICKSGKINAILGSSGAGKTTLLNVLCQRAVNAKNQTLEGEILANSQPYDSDKFSTFAAYVMQDDILLETMTVKECFQFAANLKTKGTAEEKNQKVDEMIRELRLEKCQNTFIGGLFVKGISGGEKKRTSIGYELISNPSCIFLDEPTSGLDSFTAYSIIHLLSNYAHNNDKTVTFTIHQPSTDIWNLFDHIILMVDGQFIYQGDGKQNIINHFSSIGFSCPIKSNPSDYLMSIMHGGSEVNVKNYEKYFQGYKNKLEQQAIKEIKNTSVEILPHNSVQNSILYQIKVLAERQFKIIKRNPILSRARLAQAIITALFIGLVFLRMPGPNDNLSQRDVQDRNGVLFLCIILSFMLQLNPSILTFPSQRNVFLREENQKLYTVFTYFLGRIIVDIIPAIIFPIISSLILYWMVGFNDEEALRVLTFIFVMVLMSLAGLAFGYLGGSAFSDAKVATSLAPLVLMPFMLFAGLYKNASDYASWIGWIQYISPIKYGFIAVVRNEYNYEGQGYIQDPVKQLNFTMSTQDAIYCLVGIVVVALILSFIFLLILKKRLQ